MQIKMQERRIEGRMILCPFVVCEGCGMLIDAEEEVLPGFEAVVEAVEPFRAYHETCVGRLPRWRKLSEFLTQLGNNSR